MHSTTSSLHKRPLLFVYHTPQQAPSCPATHIRYTLTRRFMFDKCLRFAAWYALRIWTGGYDDQRDQSLVVLLYILRCRRQRMQK